MTFSELLNLNGQGEPWVCRLLDRHMCGLGTSELVSELMGGDRGFHTTSEWRQNYSARA